jgi:hypothetical protein
VRSLHAKRQAPVRGDPELVEGSNHERSAINSGDEPTNLLMPQGSNFLLLRQKKSHQRKGDPDDCPDPAMLRKKRNGKNSLRSNSFPF